MIVGIVQETYPGERRVALTPATIPLLAKAGLSILVQSGAGEGAGFSDQDYQSKGAVVVANRLEVFEKSDVICQVRAHSANSDRGRDDLRWMRSGQTVIGLADPLGDLQPIQELASTGVQSFALELIPRITRAQSMDVLSSQATVIGYKALILAANVSPRMFGMMMTAAGTNTAAKVFVIGAGVAGLQAIASAKRMGAIVQAYDVRSVVKEQVQSLGAKFLELELATAGAEDKGGYAKAMDDTFYRRQRELMSKTVVQSDVVITTAAVPGARPPVLITSDMVRTMLRGSVIIDLAARPNAIGGNCELTQPDQEVAVNGVTILGPTNLPATVPYSASQMFSKNIAAFLLNLVKDGKLLVDMNDEIMSQTLLTQHGVIVNARVKQILAQSIAASPLQGPA